MHTATAFRPGRPAVYDVPMHTTTAPAGALAAPFSYGRVAVEHREWLRQTTETIRTALKRTAANLVQVGRALADARGRLPRGQWEEWAAAEMPWSLPTSRRLIRVGMTFGDVSRTDQIDRFGSSALYAFCSPGCPPAARAYALELAADGQRITHALAKEILDAHRREPDPDAKEVRGYAKAAKQLDATRDDPPDLPAAEVHRLAGEALAELAAKSTVVHIGTTTEDDGEDRPLFSVTCYPRDMTAGVTCRQGYSLLDVLLVVLGRPRLKPCPGCGDSIEVTKFSVNASQPDGWNRRCRECETERLRRHKAKKKAAKLAAGPIAPTPPPPGSGPTPTAS